MKKEFEHGFLYWSRRECGDPLLTVIGGVGSQVLIDELSKSSLIDECTKKHSIGLIRMGGLAVTNFLEVGGLITADGKLFTKLDQLNSGQGKSERFRDRLQQDVVMFYKTIDAEVAFGLNMNGLGAYPYKQVCFVDGNVSRAISYRLTLGKGIVFGISERGRLAKEREVAFVQKGLAAIVKMQIEDRNKRAVGLSAIVTQAIYDVAQKLDH